MFLAIYTITLLLVAVSIDAFSAGLSYGMNRVKIPFSSTFIMSAMSGTFLILSLLAGSFLQELLPQNFIKYFSFFILFILGLYRLFDTFLPKTIENVNKDDLTILSPKEAFWLGLALSLDNIAAGFGFQVGFLPPLLIFVTAVAVNFLIIRIGCLVGREIITRTTLNLAWIGAVLLLLLAFSRLLQ